MKPPVFSSFEEIDIRLEMLALEREISMHALRADLSLAATETVKRGLGLALKPALKTLAYSWALKTVRRKLLKE